MANWKTAKTASGGRGDVKRLNLSKDIPTGSQKKIRFIGPLLPRYQYWVSTHDGSRTIECLAFDREKEAFCNKEDDILVEKIDDKGEKFIAQFAYVTQCIDRETGELCVLELKKTLYNDIVALASDPEYGDPSDAESGYDLTISKVSTGPLPINIKYKALPGRGNTPLTKEELGLKLYDLEALYKRPTVDEQREWLLEHTDYLKEAPTLADDVVVEFDKLPI